MFSNQDLKTVLSKNVAKYRIAKNLTKEELSLALGFENSYISKLEKCKMNITLVRLEKIAKYFEIEAYKLLK